VWKVKDVLVDKQRGATQKGQAAITANVMGTGNGKWEMGSTRSCKYV